MKKYKCDYIHYIQFTNYYKCGLTVAMIQPQLFKILRFRSIITYDIKRLLPYGNVDYFRSNQHIDRCFWATKDYLLHKFRESKFLNVRKIWLYTTIARGKFRFTGINNQGSYCRN